MSGEVWTYRKSTGGSANAGLTSSGTASRLWMDRSGRSTRRHDAGSAYVIVDTGTWIFGKKVMLPAGLIAQVDHDDEKVFVNRTKEQIKHAPEFDESLTADESYRGNLGSYYGTGGAGYRDWDDTAY